MDEALRTSATYEQNADAYEEKYLGGSVAADHGGPFVDELDGDRVLDVGCGPGSDSATFADTGLDVTGLDVTQSFLVAAADHLDEAGAAVSQPGSAAFARGDMRSLPLDTDAFDGVWCCAALHHVPKDEAGAALAEFARVLRDDGMLFCSVKRGANAGFEPDDDHGDGDDRFFAYYSSEEFEDVLDDAGLDGNVRLDDRWVSALASPR
ncbi:class I SAM-dependent methyltransferase [Halobacterium zhouii]|uniref:class I SAM-dependent methyltransferase n=1 Tax=Halobacterium zhouii TaxID=2902624 RepID=UPI001E5CC2F5|nr:class I SAM-dependent methyltransferase [Halobacterium zhouii]